MSLIETISSDFMKAYKAKEMEKKDFLGVLKTEVTKETKTPDDSSVIAKVKSMIKAAESTNSLTDSELNILNGYLPQQMSEDVLKVTIDSYINANGITSPKEMGKIMGYLKTNFNGKYDGKLASTIIKELLV
jgi:uncharacterized protein YqeY